jgi:hypothetical protein
MPAYAKDIFRGGVKIARKSELGQRIVRFSLLTDITDIGMYIAREIDC